MDSIVINGKEVAAKIGDDLKPILEQNGFSFPCGGKGICGKCLVFLPAHPPTQKDLTFLTDGQIRRGFRLACDKQVLGNEIISFEPKGGGKKIKISDAVVAIILSEDSLEAGIFDDDVLIEKKRIEFEENPEKRILKSIIDGVCIGLYEEYGVAKAKTLAISGRKELVELVTSSDISDSGDFYPAETFSLPSESVFVLPYIKGLVDGTAVLELSALPVPCVAVNTDAYIALIKEDEIKYIPLGVLENTPFCEALVKASLRYLLKGERIPIVYPSGKAAEIVSEITGLEFTCAEERDLEILNIAAKSSINNRQRAKLFRIRNKITYMDISGEEAFQELLNLAYSE